MSDSKLTVGVDLFSRGTRNLERSSLYYDASTGILGFGYRYGAQSFNGRPLHEAPLEAFWGPKRSPLYDSFLRPLNSVK